MIIAIDGLDGSGKETTCTRLAAWIEDQKMKTYVHSFPDYSVPSGAYIKQIIGNPETLKDMPSNFKPYFMASLFAFNRAEHFNYAYKFMDEFDIHIFDRYWASNVLYQGLGMSRPELVDFVDHCYQLDITLNNPMPDIYYFIELPYKVLRRRIDFRTKKEITNDSYEKDEFQKAVYHLSELLLADQIFVKDNNVSSQYFSIYDAVIKPYDYDNFNHVIEDDAETVVEMVIKDLEKRVNLKGVSRND